MSKYKEANIKVDDLLLDQNNPRFAELFVGEHNEENLIKYLLKNEAALEVAKAISDEQEFYRDRPLWVIKKDGKYLVKDGNRRCAAVKALNMQGQYGLDLPVVELKELPVLIYNNEDDLNKRIFNEHANSLFRSWERIAKALEVYRLFKTGTSLKSMKDYDSSPGQLLKLASFYYEAVKIGGSDFKNLLTRGRGKTGGRAVIFERLFVPKYSSRYGCTFSNNPTYSISVDNPTRFSKYILSMIEMLQNDDNYEIKTDLIDQNPGEFFSKLKEHGFDIDEKLNPIPSPTPNPVTSALSVPTPSSTTPSPSPSPAPNGTGGGFTPAANGNSPVPASGSSGSGNNNNGSTKKYPVLKRKGLPPGIKTRITEYFKLDADEFTNPKVAMSRVTFECVLKYVIENTKYNGKTTIHKTSPFNAVYSSKIANATLMKIKFTELIINTGDQNAFKSLNLDELNQIIHNYKVGALVKDAKQIAHNMIHLIEFLLQDEADLLSSLDLTKL